MDDEIQYWVPDGALHGGQGLALAVAYPSKPLQNMFTGLLTKKLQHSIDNMFHQEAQDTMEMSSEHLPEIYLIGKNQTSDQWAYSIAHSDSMHMLINRIDWSKPGSFQWLEPQGLMSILEQLP